MIDVETVRASRRDLPMSYPAQIGQAGNRIIEGSRMHRNTRSAAASVTHQRGRPGKSIDTCL